MKYKILSVHPAAKIILLPCLLILAYACTHIDKNHSHQQVPDANILRGKKLAAVYCQSCHLLPDPSLLDSKHWEQGVLPGMGPRLGIFNDGFTEYPSSRYDRELDSGYYPKTPVITPQEWHDIIDYFTSVSPDSLPGQQRTTTVQVAKDLFSVEAPSGKTSNAATCLVKIDSSVTPHRLLTADAITRKLFSFDDHLLMIDSIQNRSAVVDIQVLQQGFLTCNIGNMAPNNGRHGNASIIELDQKGKMIPDSSHLFDKLARPVELLPADFNGDARTDYLVCEFGNLRGALSWMEQLAGGEYKRHVIRGIPGAIKAYVQDVNHDGLPDIWALFAQGDEGIFLFVNKGGGQFEQEEVLRFQPIFGSSYFELADFNKDGFPDILYTCGDNADYSPVLKPYHGVYIFTNDGRNHFKQAYFFPMHGCFKAVARDFDGDGDLDIASISFFADYTRQSAETFIYLQNNGNWLFQPWSIPGTAAGRWLTMDAADMDGDGRPDIVLGNFSIAPAAIASKQHWNEGPPFIVLKNKIKK